MIVINRIKFVDKYTNTKENYSLTTRDPKKNKEVWKRIFSITITAVVRGNQKHELIIKPYIRTALKQKTRTKKTK